MRRSYSQKIGIEYQTHEQFLWLNPTRLNTARRKGEGGLCTEEEEEEEKEEEDVPLQYLLMVTCNRESSSLVSTERKPSV